MFRGSLVALITPMQANGDLDRESYLAEVENGKQIIKATLPMINP